MCGKIIWPWQKSDTWFWPEHGKCMNKFTSATPLVLKEDGVYAMSPQNNLFKISENIYF
jgi:hypothetical protein